MKIEPLRYRDLSKAFRCTAGAAELIVVTEIGPRILSLRWRGGVNLLYEDTTGFSVGDWHLYGGHRFTVAPEGEESYAPDNAPCVVETHGSQLRVTTEPSVNGIRRVLVISAARDGIGFDVQHVLENHGKQPWHGAAWAITCVPHASVVSPFDPSIVRFWPGTNQDDWNLGPDHVASIRRETRGKIGWHSDSAWLASLQPDATFVIHSPNAPCAEDCVDDGCNVEIFNCAEYTELETLGGAIVLAPGDQASHVQRWRLLESQSPPYDWRMIAAQAGCDSTPAMTHVV